MVAAWPPPYASRFAFEKPAVSMALTAAAGYHRPLISKSTHTAYTLTQYCNKSVSAYKFVLLSVECLDNLKPGRIPPKILVGYTVVVLAIDDDPQVLESYRALLSDMGVSFECTTDPNRGLELVRQLAPELVLLKWQMPQMPGIEALRRIHNLDTRARIAIIYDSESLDTVVEAIMEGADSFVCKPFDPEKLRTIVEEVKGIFKRRAHSAKIEMELVQHFNVEGMIGRSTRMLELFDLIRRVAPHFRTVLVLGETGTGKEVVARALHKRSPRRDQPFIVCNCAAVVESLFESELFGHRKGAFTGAHEDRMGVFESANGGTVFLDEIGELGAGVQSKLLRVLQNQEIQRVGSTQPQHVDVLLIAATSRDLKQDVKLGKFRSDLLFRLNMVEMVVPPLRERADDIPLLYRHFLQKFNQQYGKQIQGISRRAQDLMIRYSWPGNVRQMENVMGLACMLAHATFLDMADFNSISSPSATNASPSPSSMDEAERDALLRALKENPNKTQVARILGVSRPRLYRLMKKHGLRESGDTADKELVSQG
jgi:two-component system response regulator HydG